MSQSRRYLYDYGLPFSKCFTESLDSLSELILHKKVGCIIVDGASGQGKTTLGVHLAEYLDKEFEWENQIGMGGSKFMKCADWSAKNERRVVVYDEAGDFSKRGALSGFNKMMNRFFETYRMFKLIPIICIPRFYALDNHLFELEIPQLLFNVYDRTDRQGSIRCYGLREMFYMKNNVKSMVLKPLVYKTAHPILYGQFLNLPPDKEAKLASMSAKAKKQIAGQSIVRSENLVCTNEIVSLTGISYNNVTVKLRMAKVQPAFKIGLRKYYDKKVLDMFKNRYTNN